MGRGRPPKAGAQPRPLPPKELAKTSTCGQTSFLKFRGQTSCPSKGKEGPLCTRTKAGTLTWYEIHQQCAHPNDVLCIRVRDSGDAPLSWKHAINTQIPEVAIERTNPMALLVPLCRLKKPHCNTRKDRQDEGGDKRAEKQSEVAGQTEKGGL